MFCPNCGQKSNFEQVYCRSCGAALGETSHKLSKYYADLDGKIDWFKRSGLFSIGLILGGIMIYLFALIIDALRIGRPFGFFLLFSIPAILTGIISVLYFETKQSKKVKRELIKDKNFAPNLIETAQSHRQLNESSFQPIGSVTDHTTELFTSKIPRIRTSGDLS